MAKFGKTDWSFLHAPPEEIEMWHTSRIPNWKQDQLIMARFGKTDLSFVKAPPEEIEIVCSICLQVMLDDPHLVSCCGHHFCGPCIKRVKHSNRPCPGPYCKERKFEVMSDKGHLRIINGLQVNCTNKGCGWKGELKSLPSHINTEKREGECQFEVVKCKYDKCKVKQQRQHLKIHEKEKCDQRPYACLYCRHKGTYQYITQQHYPKCTRYPVPCPNECRSDGKFPRCDIKGHLSTVCPLQPVECEFKWAGCHYRSLRKDLHQHNIESQLNHMSLLAKSCGELKKENEELKRENGESKVEYQRLKKQNSDMKQQLESSVVVDHHLLLPVTVSCNNDRGVRYFYSKPRGHLMSVKVICLWLSYNITIKVYREKSSQLPRVSEIVMEYIKYRSGKGVKTTSTIITKDNCESYIDTFDERSDVIQEFTLKTNLYSFDIVSIK